jgi:hypothetical protein
MLRKAPLLYSDMVHKSNDLDSFLTDIGPLPSATQNKLLQEKIVLLHSKLASSLTEL